MYIYIHVHGGLLQADVQYLYFPNRTVIEKWMEETTNPMMLMQSAFPEAAGVPNTLRSNHACLTLMPPPQKNAYNLYYAYGGTHDKINTRGTL